MRVTLFYREIDDFRNHFELLFTSCDESVHSCQRHCSTCAAEVFILGRHIHEENKIKTVTRKYEWSTSTIDRILDNEKYVGDVIMQKSFTENSLTGKRKKNNGELDMYFIENNHEPIISRDIFERVKLKKRKILLNNKG